MASGVRHVTQTLHVGDRRERREKDLPCLERVLGRNVLDDETGHRHGDALARRPACGRGTDELGLGLGLHGERPAAECCVRVVLARLDHVPGRLLDLSQTILRGCSLLRIGVGGQDELQLPAAVVVLLVEKGEALVSQLERPRDASLLLGALSALVE